LDESSFYLLPSVVRTWAPKGQTPILKWWTNWNHLSAIAAISPQGGLYTMIREREGTFRSEDIIKFLRYLLTEIEGKLGVVWDGVSVHRSKELKQFLQEEGHTRIELARLPAYAPDLNPTEGVWSYVKGFDFRNLCCHNLNELRERLKGSFANLQSEHKHGPNIIKACFQQPACY